MSSVVSLNRHRSGPVLITGGGGFIGCNIADALATRGDRVLILDSLARTGAEENIEWLTARHGKQIEVKIGDVRHADLVIAAVAESSAVLHLAGQVAVTTSLQHPLDDFEVNARGTLNVLEAVRLHNPAAPVIFASTNKVYGRLLDDDAIVQRMGRYIPTEERFADGVSESTSLDFYSPYGCSKGAAEQYVRDYARVFGLRTVVLRMSCIYGPRQFGNEDQGWVAHFMLQMLRRKPVTIFGDGLQVRDILHISDAVAAWLRALDQADQVGGRVFNLGGGPDNSVSLIELLDLLAEIRNETIDIRFASWRPGDQPWYVSDIQAISQALDWKPLVAVRDGLATLERWLDGRFGRRSPPRQIMPASAEVQA